MTAANLNVFSRTPYTVSLYTVQWASVLHHINFLYIYIYYILCRSFPGYNLNHLWINTSSSFSSLHCASYLVEVFLRLFTRLLELTGLLTEQSLVSELTVVDRPVTQARHLRGFNLKTFFLILVIILVVTPGSGLPPCNLIILLFTSHWGFSSLLLFTLSWSWREFQDDFHFPIKSVILQLRRWRLLEAPSEGASPCERWAVPSLLQLWNQHTFFL